MPAQPKAKMTVDEFLAWAEDRPGRYELEDGEVIAMAPQRVQHAAVKFAVQAALGGAIRAAGAGCHMLPDGMTVRVDDATAYEPDALVYCGKRIAGDAIEVPNPVIVVEVLSPSTHYRDFGVKLAGYFQVASVQHYLILDPERRRLIHHRRGEGLIETRVLGEGTLLLAPPGIEISIAELFAES